MISFHFRGDLTKAPCSGHPKLLRLITDLSALTGAEIVQDPEVDFEDWSECAEQLRTVLNTGVEIEISWSRCIGTETIDTPLSDDLWDDDAPFLDEGISLNAAEAEMEMGAGDGAPSREVPIYETRTLHVSGEAVPSALMGMVGDQDTAESQDNGHVWPDLNDAVAIRYPETLTFQRHAGREIRICDMPGGDPHHTYPVNTPLLGTQPQTDLIDALKAFGGREVAVKQAWPLKSMPVRFVRVEAGQEKQASHEVFAFDPYHILRYEGDRNALIVQDKITMTHETRYFIVDGEPVSGAGCIEAHTPFDREPENIVGVTHAVFEVTRNGGEIIADTQAAAKMEAFVRGVAAELRAELPDLRHVVVDVALNAEGDPIIIELNPYQNAGLYANDPDAIFTPVTTFIKEKALSPSPTF